VKKVRKPATLFLIIVSIGMLFAGAVSAEDASVDVIVTDQVGTSITVASPGDEVGVIVGVDSNDETLTSPWVEITLDPETGLQLKPEDATMWDGTQLIQNDMTNYPNNAFFFWDDIGQVWVWDIAYKYGNGNMPPDKSSGLIVKAVVGATGDINVNADLFEFDQEPVFVDSDNYTVLSVGTDSGSTANAATVPMQNTGAPIAAAMLGILSIIGGTIYSRLK
jgi:hypothetical protein